MLWNEIREIYFTRGDQRYMIEEHITQIQHGIQTSLKVKELGGSEALQVAGLLHDIGHLVQDNINPSDNIDDRHEVVGSEWLKSRGFHISVYYPAELHVNAKRYLCARDEKYIDTLSPASKHTLILQSGIMTDEECKKFEKDIYFKDAILIRKADDLGKDIAVDDLPSFDEFESLVKRVHYRSVIIKSLIRLKTGRIKWETLDHIVSRVKIENVNISNTIKTLRTFSELYKNHRKRNIDKDRKKEAETFQHVINRLINDLIEV